MPRRAVLFDLDGTLIDSLDDIGDSMNFVLQSMGLGVHGSSDYRAFVGDGAAMLVRRSLPEARRDPATVAEALGRFREVYPARATQRTRLYDGIPQLLDALTERRVPMAVLSNKMHDLTVRLAGELLGRWRFEVVFGERPGVPRKPDPSSALEVASLLGVAPGAVLYVGDTPTDLETARRAGMPAVAATWGFRSADELRAAGAECIALHPRDVLSAFEQEPASSRRGTVEAPLPAGTRGR